MEEKQTIQNPSEAVHFFYEMSQCVENLYCRAYDVSGRLLFGNCPDEEIFRALFMRSGFLERVVQYAAEHDAPYGIGTYMGLEWFAVLEKKEGVLRRIHLLGPVLFSSIEHAQMEYFLREYEAASGGIHSKYVLLKAIEQLPVLFQKQFGQLALMLHYALTGERLPCQALQYMVDKQLDETRSTAPQLYRDMYRQSAKLLESLKLGVVPKAEILQSKWIALLPTNAAQIHKPLRQLKDTAVAYIVQCANAAVEGGALPEDAYTLADTYIGSIEQNRSSVELISMMTKAYAEFAEQVCQEKRKEWNYSEEVSFCMDYVCHHPEEELSLLHLASMVGYSDYYLSRKFKAETGMALPEYIRQQRIEYGAVLLQTTTEDIETIAQRLHFCSRSHFSDVFHKVKGMPPSEYRANLIKNMQTAC